MDQLPDWLEGLAAAVTVTDRTGRIVAMNRQAAETFAASGGVALVGSDVLDCHPEPSRSRLAAMLAGGAANHYTTEKAGQRRMVHQLPWLRDGEFAGLVEIAVEIPASLPHVHRS